MLAGKGEGNEVAQVHEEECIVIAIEKLHRKKQLDSRQREHLHSGKVVRNDLPHIYYGIHPADRHARQR
jgi:hypothetical protein